MVSSFRMHAVITTLNGLPALWRRSANVRSFSLHRLAVRAAMYSAFCDHANTYGNQLSTSINPLG